MSLKQCPFCHKSPPEIKFSKEHILRNKLNDSFPPLEKGVEWVNQVSNPDGTVSLTRKKIPQGPFDRTINSVCKQCNESWMNFLEDEVEDDLLNLIYGRAESPSQNGRLALARWTVKTAGVYSLLHRDGRPGFPEAHFSHLKNNQEPPPFTYVWLCQASFVHNSFMRYKRYHLSAAPDLSFYIYTLSIGKVVFCVLGSNSKETASKLLIEVGLRDMQAERLWPPTKNKPIDKLIITDVEAMTTFSNPIIS